MGQPARRKQPGRSYVISLENRKARGFGHERPQEILSAARELFLEHGVENVSTRQIASRVGISQTSLYVYFKHKEEMLEALVDLAFGKLGAAFQKLDRPDDPVAYLRLAIEGYIRFGLSNPDEYRIAFLLRSRRRKQPEAPQDGQQDIGRRAFGMLEGLVAEAVATGGVQNAELQEPATAQVVWASIHGLVALLLSHPDFGWEPVDILIKTHIDVLLQGLIGRSKDVSPQPGLSKAQVGLRTRPKSSRKGA